MGVPRIGQSRPTDSGPTAAHQGVPPADPALARAASSPCPYAYHALVTRSSTVHAFVTPMAAQPVTTLPTADEWLYEWKRDESPDSSIVIDPACVRVPLRKQAS